MFKDGDNMGNKCSLTIQHAGVMLPIVFNKRPNKSMNKTNLVQKLVEMPTKEPSKIDKVVLSRVPPLENAAFAASGELILPE